MSSYSDPFEFTWISPGTPADAQVLYIKQHRAGEWVPPKKKKKKTHTNMPAYLSSYCQDTSREIKWEADSRLQTSVRVSEPGEPNIAWQNKRDLASNQTMQKPTPQSRPLTSICTPPHVHMTTVLSKNKTDVAQYCIKTAHIILNTLSPL